MTEEEILNFKPRSHPPEPCPYCAECDKAHVEVARLRVLYEGIKAEVEELRRLLANATDPENSGDWEEAREILRSRGASDEFIAAARKGMDRRGLR